MAVSEKDRAAKVVRLRDRRPKRRGTPWWRWCITLTLGLGVVVAAWVLFKRIESSGLPPLIPVLSDARSPSYPSPAGGSAFGQTIEPLGSADEAALERQREFVEHLAHRHVGTGLRRTREDLRVLQALVDRGAVKSDQRWELQALGVALGDLFVADFGLSWVVVNDEYGRSRALRYKNSDNLIFPVTMISRRVENNIAVDVQELYREIADIVEQLESRQARLDGE